jgi:hypothetical protein
VVDKYLHIKEETIMVENDEHDELSPDDDALEIQRSIIRQSLDEIASDFGAAMRDARLHFPLGLTVPNSGDAVATMVTPDDPSDDDWARASKIVCQVISTMLDGISLHGRPLPCTMVNATISATEIAPNALDFDMRA